jgi:hypothetical protein
VSRLPLLARELERVPAGRPAGVGDEDLDGAEVALDAPEQLGRRVEVERVVDVRAGADLTRRGLDLLPRSRADRHPGALARQLLGDPKADALRGARYERDFSVKTKVHWRQRIRVRV